MPERRTLPDLSGEVQDLGAVFDAHVAYEFETKDVDATMGTMVDEPHVTHVPTLAGGVDAEEVRRFYGTHFIENGRMTSSSPRCPAPSVVTGWWTS